MPEVKKGPTYYVLGINPDQLWTMFLVEKKLSDKTHSQKTSWGFVFMPGLPVQIILWSQEESSWQE